MVDAWKNSARYLFIPLIVENTPGYDEPPADYAEYVRRRVYFDPDPQSSEDRSLMSYISSISYGRATVDATVADPITITNLSEEDNPTLLAINAHPSAHEFEYLAVVYPPNRRGAGGGMAQPGQIQFSPPRPFNRTKARSRFRHDEAIGTWAMEIIHNVTNLTDYYNGVAHPGEFDEMAAAAATHPTTYSKLELGWLDPAAVPLHGGGKRRYTIHAVGLSQPPPGGRFAGVRIRGVGSKKHRYLYVEARLKNDRWERGFSNASSGIPSEGVIICEFSPQYDSWPRNSPSGPWPPLELRTPTALGVGESFVHGDSRSTIRVVAQTAGGFRIEVEVQDVAVPRVVELDVGTATRRISEAGLEATFSGQQGRNAWVWKQSPQPGVKVAPGSTVTLQLRNGPIP